MRPERRGPRSRGAARSFRRAGSWSLAAGSSFRVDKFVAIVDGLAEELPSLAARAQEAVHAAASEGYEALEREQEAVVSRFWAGAAISVDGDPEVEEGLRFNIFHLLQSAGRDGRTNLAAKGLSGEGYEGHYFWDTEIYALPFFTYEAPEIARALVQYRIGILDKARERARELSLPGALFPWRTIDGEETSAYYPAGTAQFHIDADIAYALSRYAAASGDVGILAEGGAELPLRDRSAVDGFGLLQPPQGRALLHTLRDGARRVQRPRRQQRLHEPHGRAQPAHRGRGGRGP